MTQPNQFTPRPSPRSCYNALDRHVLAGRGGDSCMIFEGNDKGYESTMTYAEVLAEVSRVVSACRGARRGIAGGACSTMPACKPCSTACPAVC